MSGGIQKIEEVKQLETDEKEPKVEEEAVIEEDTPPDLE